MKKVKKLSIRPTILHSVMFGEIKKYKDKRMLIKMSEDKMLLEIYLEESN